MYYIVKKRLRTIILLGLIFVMGMCGCKKSEGGTETIEGTKVLAENITEVLSIEGNQTDRETEADNPDAETEENKSGGDRENITPEEQILQVLTEAEDLYFTSGGVMLTELLGYVEEKDASYFIMKKQNDLGYGGETLFVGVMSRETDELIQCCTYGNTTADAVMIEKEKGIYIMYVTECTDFGLISGSGGVLLAKDGKLTPVWPLAEDGTLDDAFWNQRTVKRNGTAFELYKVITEEEMPGVPALQSKTEFERTITLEDVLGI